MKIVNIFKSECADWRFALFTISCLFPVYYCFFIYYISDLILLGMVLSSALMAISIVDFKK